MAIGFAEVSRLKHYLKNPLSYFFLVCKTAFHKFSLKISDAPETFEKCFPAYKRGVKVKSKIPDFQQGKAIRRLGNELKRSNCGRIGGAPGPIFASSQW